MFFTNFRRLNASDALLKVAFTDLAIATGVTVYSETIKVERNVGFATVVIGENKAGGLGSVDVWPEYSIDGVNFYRAYTTTGAALTIEDKIVAALQNVTRWIIYTARIAKFMRFAVLANADSQVSLDFGYQEDQ